MERFQIDPELHAALTAQYGSNLDELGGIVGKIMQSVQDAGGGIAGAFYQTYSNNAAPDVVAHGNKVLAALREMHEALGTGRQAYVATETANHKSFTNLPHMERSV